jgi:hypothetical protein
MAFTSVTKLYDELVTFTYEKYGHKKVMESVFQGNPLLKYLMSGDRYVPTDGGTFIVEPVSLVNTVAPSAVDAYDPINVNPSNDATVATFKWAFYARGITVSEQELAKNNGESAIIDLVQFKIQHAADSFRDAISQAVYANADDSGSPTPLIGLRYHVADDPTSTSIGSLATSETNWRNQYGTMASLGGNASFATSSSGVIALRKMLKKCTFGNEVPDLIIAPEDGYTAYENAVGGTQQTLVPAGLGDLGFQTLQLSGIPIVFDRHIGGTLAGSDGRFYFLNTKHFKLRYHSDWNFKMTESRSPANALVNTRIIGAMLQTTQDARRLQGVITSAAA